MNSSNTPNRDRLHSTSSTNTGHDATYKAALKGASLAFQKGAANNNTSNSLSKSAPAHHQTTNGNANANGALIAATSASRDHSLSRPPSVNYLSAANAMSRQGTGRSGISTQNAPSATGQSHLLSPGRTATVDSRSPSFIAATLAASRSTSPSSKAVPTPYQNPHQFTGRGFPRGSLGDDDADNSVADLDLTADTSSIGPANSLISLFERKMEEVDPVKKSPATPTPRKGFNSTPGLRPMTPPKTTKPVVSLDTSPSRVASALAWEKASPSRETAKFHIGLETQTQTQRIEEENKRQPPTPPPARTKRSTKLPAPETVPKTERKLLPVTPAKAIARSPTVIISPQPRKAPSREDAERKSDQVSAFGDQPLAHPATKRRDSAPKATPRSHQPSADAKAPPSFILRRSSTSLSTDTFVSAASTPSNSPRRKSSYPSAASARPSSAATPSSSPALLNAGLISPPRPIPQVQRPPSSNVALESLTNAIVAGSLASARAPPRAAKPPTPPPRKQTPHMRQTMRAPRTKSEEEETLARSQGKKPLSKLSSRKKHSHHEGARKRWREEITARERQRYEGVWASNRGMLLDEATAAANGLRGVDTSMLVANVVVRDIWSRSRLPFDELAEVWDLVDTRRKGVLDKAQFVVGMWLVDQRLRGRKIPTKVSDSVWGSAKGVRVLGPQEKKK